MELFEKHLNNTCGSMEFHGTWATKPQVPWNSMEFCPYPKFHGIPWNFWFSPKKFHGIPWNLINFIFKKIIFLNIVFGIWLMIRCYLAKISQKGYILHWFQYRNSYFEHPSVNENGARSAKMVCCLGWSYNHHTTTLCPWQCIVMAMIREIANVARWMKYLSSNSVKPQHTNVYTGNRMYIRSEYLGI